MNDEVMRKLAQLRGVLTDGIAGVRLCGTDWFAWATAGGSNAVLLAAETGVAEVLVTAEDAWILTDQIEAARLEKEEVPAGFRFAVFDWAAPAERENFVEKITRGPVLSDRPCPGERPLPEALWQARWQLDPEEQQRYCIVGRLAAEAMGEALLAAQPDWSERQLAGAGAAALWKRGLEPALVLAAGAERLPRFRHPLPTAAPLGPLAMLVFCARSRGLYANCTRFVAFGSYDDRPHALVREIEADVLDASQPNHSLAELYTLLAASYARRGLPEAIREHHQGGITGYQAREHIAIPADTDVLLAPEMALAWNPSLPGAKVEDTFLLRADGQLDNLTLLADWPSIEVRGRMRPLPLGR